MGNRYTVKTMSDFKYGQIDGERLLIINFGKFYRKVNSVDDVIDYAENYISERHRDNREYSRGFIEGFVEMYDVLIKLFYQKIKIK